MSLMDKLLLCLKMWYLVKFVLDVLEESLIRSDLRKFLAERSKPDYLQKGAIKCVTCNKWFKGLGGLTVHTCRT